MSSAKDVIVYFPNWYLTKEDPPQGAEVCSIPWDRVSYVNHAFWYVEPADGSRETSFQRRAAGLPPRTAFRICSLTPEADLGPLPEGAGDSGLCRTHFQQYAAYAEKYPQVNILISIGGWTRCGWFSEMAYTREGRTSFVNSCLELMEKYPWIGGYDIDWEYFGGTPGGEREPAEPDDQGCPIWGTAQEDSRNLASLIRQLREAMSGRWGRNSKKLTACACGSTWTLQNQDWSLLFPYLDRINIMSYDLAGVWDHMTDHASQVFGAKAAADFIHSTYGVPYEKLCIGSPLYGTDMKMLCMPRNGDCMGMPVEPVRPADAGITQTLLKQWEAQAVSGYTLQEESGRYAMGPRFSHPGRGWHMGFDEEKRGAYLWNDDPASPFYLWFVSYENALTLQDKLDLVRRLDAGGMLVWECTQDTADHTMIRQMGTALL